MEGSERRFKPLGENIQRFRKRAKLSQEDLARELIVSRQTVSLWETGQTMPTIDNLIRLREIFGVTVDDILSGAYELGVLELRSDQGHSEPDERYSFEYKKSEIADMRRRAMTPPVILAAAGGVMLVLSIVLGLVSRMRSYACGVLLGAFLAFGAVMVALGGVCIKRGLKKCRRLSLLEHTAYRYELYGDSAVVEVQQGIDRYMEVIPLGGSTTVTEGGGFFTVLFGSRRYYIRSADVPEDSQLRTLAGQKKVR
jgi:transcriptional regulator with XRE-family HTH domain